MRRAVKRDVQNNSIWQDFGWVFTSDNTFDNIPKVLISLKLFVLRSGDEPSQARDRLDVDDANLRYDKAEWCDVSFSRFYQLSLNFTFIQSHFQCQDSHRWDNKENLITKSTHRFVRLDGSRVGREELRRANSRGNLQQVELRDIRCTRSQHQRRECAK